MILFRAIQENRKWSKRSNFKNVDAALFAAYDPRSSVESLWSGRGYSAKQGYGKPYYAAVWEEDGGDSFGNGFLVFKYDASLRFVPVPVNVLNDIENRSDSLSLEDLKGWAKNIIEGAVASFPLECEATKKYGINKSKFSLPAGADITEKNANWTEEELRFAVKAYIDMYRKHRSGEKFVKRQYYAQLAAQFGRSEKAFEYRMQNISFVRSLMGLPWLDGLPPAKNVGANVASQIEKLINDVEERHAESRAEFEMRVSEALKRNLPRPSGEKNPKKRNTQTTQFERDPKVKAWIIEQIGNRCESCSTPAPFIDDRDLPYLELHHLRRLADDGSDTVTNAVLLCPNCHRAFHYSAQRKILLEAIYMQVKRLVRE